MKVAYVLSQNKGGLPHYAAELANAVACHADVIAFKPAETSADDVFSETVETVDVFGEMKISIPDMYNLDFDVRNNLRGLLSYRNLKRLDEFDPDVVHDPTDFFPQVKFFTKRYGLDERYPFVVTYHEVPPPVTALSSPFEAFEELLNVAIPDAHTDHIVVHSDQQRAAFEDRLGGSAAIEVIPHGVYDFFTDYDYEQRPEEPHTVLFFGNVFPGKGLDVLAEAVQLASRELPDLKLLVVGDGPLSDETERLVETADEERFELHNYFVPNERVGEFFSRAALVALPYRRMHGDGTKGHSGALSTAHSFGKPVVATRTGDFPAQVGDTDSGLVVPPDDPTALADAIVALLEDDERRKKMAANSRTQAERLSWANVAERHMTVYEAAIDAHRATDGPDMTSGRTRTSKLPGGRSR